MGRALGGFQDQVTRRLTGRILRQKTDRKWTYTSVTTAREEAGLQKMEEYIRRHQNTVEQYIAMQSLLDLCEGLEREPGEWAGIWWYKQAVINLTGSREAAAVAA